MSFLPTSYEIPQATGNGGSYMKLLPGENKVRILSAPITGWLYWSTEDKPIRLPSQPTYKPYDMRQVNQWGNPEKLKHFWCLSVYNFAADTVAILEITQASLQKAIIDLYQDEEWGDPRDYSIKIMKTGEKLETEYSVIPLRPQPLSDNVRVLVEDRPIVLEALYYGADPFSDLWKKDAREKTLARIANATAYATSLGVESPSFEKNPNTCELSELLTYLDSLQVAIVNGAIF